MGFETVYVGFETVCPEKDKQTAFYSPLSYRKVILYWLIFGISFRREFYAVFHLLPSKDLSLDCTIAAWYLGFPVFKCGRWFTPLPPHPPGANGLNHHLARPEHAPPKVHVVPPKAHVLCSIEFTSVFLTQLRKHNFEQEGGQIGECHAT